METEILKELVIIRWLLVGLFSLLVIFILFSIMNIIASRRMLGSNLDLKIRDTLIAEAQMYESKGENIKFLEASDKLVELYPDDVLAIWYYAISNYKNNHLGTALSALADLKQIDPAWSVETVDEYISVIKSEMKGPKSV